MESKPHESQPQDNLPIPLSSFIGREAEIARVRDLLSAARLLTLTGVGGSGKTRLTIEVARSCLSQYALIAWVELAQLGDPQLIVQSVAVALGVSEQNARDPTQTLIESLNLKPAPILLVIDNCEHLIEACIHLIEKLLTNCLELRILVTSREPLNMAGETTWVVPPLQLPDSYYIPPAEALLKNESVRLFVERAHAAAPAFQLTAANAPAVVHVCRLVEGMPLAIELAAAKVKVLSAAEIAARLNASYRLLGGGNRNAPARQQTLQATIDWSHDLLAEPERVLFRRLAVFPGGFTMAAAEAVCADRDIVQGEVLDLLAHLVDKSLVRVDKSGGVTSYSMLRPIWQYARDRLASSNDLAVFSRKHAEWYLAMADQADEQFRMGSAQVDWFSNLEMEHDNLRAALEWGLANAPDLAGRITAGIWRFWLFHGYLSEGRRWLERILPHVEQDEVRMNALLGAGLLALFQNDYARARAPLEASLELAERFESRSEMASALCALGILAQEQTDYDAAARSFEKSLAIARQASDTRIVVMALSWLTLAVMCQGDYARAVQFGQESLDISRERNDPQGLGGALTTLGIALLEQRDYAQAEALCQEALALRRQIGDKGGCAHTLSTMGRIAVAQGRLAQAAADYRESLSLRDEIGDLEGRATALEGTAAIALGLGDPRQAALLLGASARLRDRIGAPASPIEHAFSERSLSACRRMLGAGELESALQAGRSLSQDQVDQLVQRTVVDSNKPASTSQSVTTPVAPAANPFGLTAREIEVLRLVTLGLTYNQIAEKLVISPRTADAHLRSIYGKLGVNSRSAATRLAVEKKLV